MADKRIRVGRPEEKFIYIDKSVGKLLPASATENSCSQSA